MPGTELETQTWIKLTLIAERARREPQCQFTSLAHLLDEGFLAACYRRLGRDRASGVDGVTWQEYGEHLTGNLGDLVARLKAKRYKPLPARRVYIPKDERSQRPLGLPSLEDKIVQKGIALILEAIYEADFLDCSYGFRPGRGCLEALDAVDKTIMTQPVNHLIDAAMKIHIDLGPGLLESVYEMVLAKALTKRGFHVERQKPVRFEYDGTVFEEGFRADLVVEDRVIVELKSVEKRPRSTASRR